MLSLPLILISALVSTPPDQPTTQEIVRQTIQRSLPFIEKEGVAWIEKRKCVSCHQVPFMLWSLAEAERGKIPVARQKLDEWTDWSLNFCATNKPEKSKDLDGGGLDTMTLVVLSRSYSAANAKHKDALKTMAGLIVKMQKPDGSWAPGGQLPGQRRPKEETTVVTTIWAVLALKALDGQADGVKESREKAVAWLDKDIKPGKSNELWVARLLLAREFGKKQEQDDALKHLLQSQNADGGWSWLEGEKSDALATGQSLYALGVIGAADNKAVPRAWQFLVKTQQKDGSWEVPSTKKGWDVIAPTSVYWGTCWAVMGMSRTLPPPAVGSVAVPGDRGKGG